MVGGEAFVAKILSTSGRVAMDVPFFNANV